MAANVVTADRFADMLIDAAYDATPVELPRWPTVSDIDDDVDYDYLPAMAQ